MVELHGEARLFGGPGYLFQQGGLPRPRPALEQHTAVQVLGELGHAVHGALGQGRPEKPVDFPPRALLLPALQQPAEQLLGGLVRGAPVHVLAVELLLAVVKGLGPGERPPGGGQPGPGPQQVRVGEQAQDAADLGVEGAKVVGPGGDLGEHHPLQGAVQGVEETVALQPPQFPLAQQVGQDPGRRRGGPAGEGHEPAQSPCVGGDKGGGLWAQGFGEIREGGHGEFPFPHRMLLLYMRGEGEKEGEKAPARGQGALAGGAAHSGYGVDEGGTGPEVVQCLPLSLVQALRPVVRPKAQVSFHRMVKRYSGSGPPGRTGGERRRWGPIASQRASFPRGGNGSLSALLVRLSKGGVHGVFRDFPGPRAAVGTFLLGGDVVH